MHSVHKTLGESELNTSLAPSVHELCAYPNIADSVTSVLSSLLTHNGVLT